MFKMLLDVDDANKTVRCTLTFAGEGEVLVTGVLARLDQLQSDGYSGTFRIDRLDWDGVILGPLSRWISKRAEVVVETTDPQLARVFQVMYRTRPSIKVVQLDK